MGKSAKALNPSRDARQMLREAQAVSRAEQSGVNRSLGVTPKRQARWLASVPIVLRTPAVTGIVTWDGGGVKRVGRQVNPSHRTVARYSRYPIEISVVAGKIGQAVGLHHGHDECVTREQLVLA
jgi:hypothetical protein